MSILTEIFAHKRLEVAQRKALSALEASGKNSSASAPPSFLSQQMEGSPPVALIAEIKRTSPSRGPLLPPGMDILALAGIYQANGAAAVSVLTDERYFQGSLADLRAVRAAYPQLPLLRKDFICDPFQIYEARAAGASAVLLIVAGIEAGAFDLALLSDLHTLANESGLAALVEVHTEAELEIALKLGARLVGINNRDLHTFRVSLQTTLDLIPQIPAGVAVVGESGIHTGADVARLAQAGVRAVLVGEALVTAQDIPTKVRELAGVALSAEENPRQRRPRYCEG